MKLYHIDRTSHLSEGQIIKLKKNIQNLNDNDGYFNDGLSSHGVSYFLQDMYNRDYALEIIFEYERRLNFNDKLSRFQTLYAFDIASAMTFIENKKLNDYFYKIYEIETDQFEQHNMNLIRGATFNNIIKWARLYWSNGEDLVKERKPINEYLIKLPVKIGKEINYQTLQEEYNKINEGKENKNLDNV